MAHHIIAVGLPLIPAVCVAVVVVVVVFVACQSSFILSFFVCAVLTRPNSSCVWRWQKNPLHRSAHR